MLSKRTHGRQLPRQDVQAVGGGRALTPRPGVGSARNGDAPSPRKLILPPVSWTHVSVSTIGEPSEETEYASVSRYATATAADAARLAAIRAAIADGKDVYWDPDTDESFDLWEHDWRVEAHQVVQEADERLRDG